MNLNDLKQLQDCCRDQAAFEQLKQLWEDIHQSVEKTQQQLEQQIAQQQALSRVMHKIAEGLDLKLILDAAVAEVRHLLNADRAAIFRLYPDLDSPNLDCTSGYDSNWNTGEFVAEAVLPDYPSVLALRENNFVVQPTGRIQVSETTQTQAIADTDSVNSAKAELEIFNLLQIRADLAIPITQGKALWGLMYVHQCSEARQWQPSEIEFVSQMASQLSVALQQAELLKQNQQQSAELTQAAEALQQNQAQLLQSEKLSCLGHLVAGVAHEINNPVNFIYGNLVHASCYAQDLIEILTRYQQELPSPSQDLRDRIEAVELDFLIEDFPKILNSMQMGTDRIRKIVLSLRNFSRLDEIDMKPVDIHAGLDSTLLILQHRLKPSAGSGGIKVVKEYGDLPLVECHANQLNQVFMNLLSNAIDALEEQGETGLWEDIQPQISIRTMLIPSDSQGGSPHAVIQIADNGPGIPDALQTQLFNSFFTTKPIGKGTGLGLSISYQIIAEGHAGEIQCYSQPGQGTEFWIEIPIQQQACSLDSTLPAVEPIWQPTYSKASELV